MSTITNYTELSAAVAAWPDHASAAFTAQVPAFIQGCEALVNRWLRERRMQAQSTASVNTAACQLPADFAEAIAVQARAGSGEAWAVLEPATPQRVNMAAEAESAGRPGRYSILGESLVLSPAPDGAYEVQMTYYQRLTALSGSQASNWLLVSAPDVYLNGALVGAYEFLREWDAAMRFEAKFYRGLAELKRADRRPTGKLRTGLLAAGFGVSDAGWRTEAAG